MSIFFVHFQLIKKSFNNQDATRMSGVGNIQTLEFVWEIKCSHDDKNEQIYSPPFTVNGLKFEVCFILNVSPGEWMSIYLLQTDHHRHAASNKVSFTASLLNQSNEKIFEKSHYQVPMPMANTWSVLNGFPKYVKKSFVMDPANKIIKNNRLRIVCKVFCADSSPLIENEVVEKSFCRLKEFDKFETLLADDSFSDVTVTVDEKKLYAHKFLLASRSPVFKAMFEHDMKEKNTSLVNIEDIKYEVMYELIRFIYTGKVKEIEKIVCELLVVAEKYLVGGLKALCKDTMLKELDENNALKYLVAADMNNLLDAKKKISDWISLRLEKFFENTDFKSFVKLYPELFYDIIKKNYQNSKV